MASYAVIAGGVVVNRIELENGADWPVPDGCVIIEDAASPLAIGGTYVNGVYAAPAPAVVDAIPSAPLSVLSQDLIAQFTADDAAKIQAAVASNPQFWLLWSAMQAQKDPMIVTNARFLAGWNALTQILGPARLAAIATALNVAVG